jgi:hypothetical protein
MLKKEVCNIGNANPGETVARRKRTVITACRMVKASSDYAFSALLFLNRWSLPLMLRGRKLLFKHLSAYHLAFDLRGYLERIAQWASYYPISAA